MKPKKGDDLIWLKMKHLNFVLEYKIKPLLEEYYYGDTNGYKEIEKLCQTGLEES